MKTKKFLFWLVVMGIIITITYTWGIEWNNIYCDGARTFFLSSRKEDIIDSTWVALYEEFLWRSIPLVIISYILSFLKYDSSKKKKYVLCGISFIIVFVIQVYFGMAHYSKIFETEDWIMKHIELQGAMGLLYATAYNIIQHRERKIYNTSLIGSHLIAVLCSFIIHASVNALLIIKLTFWNILRISKKPSL